MTMKNEIDQQAIHNRDNDVPEFGGYQPHELRAAKTRMARPEVLGKEAFLALQQSGIDRALYFGFNTGKIPYVHFPNAEHFQHVPFAHNHWLRFGDMESEFARVNFMLEKYKSRAFPEEFDPVCREILENENVIGEWSKQIPRINRLSGKVYENIAQQMSDLKVHDDLGYSNGEQGAYQSPPVFYRVSEKGRNLENKLWEAGLKQIVWELQNGIYQHVESFLHLYNRIKDPVSPLRGILPEQARIFKELYKKCSEQILQEDNNANGLEKMVVQLALESSFLALPKAREIERVAYNGHHELPYIAIKIEELPRGEFANPKRVIEVLKELISDSEMSGEAQATPITVSYCQEPFQAKPELFIIDGNNRATAILVMKFINFVNFDREAVVNFHDHLRNFIVLYDLEIEWERDLAVALKNIMQPELELCMKKQAIIEKFAEVKVPALLVQEPNFHTVAVSLSQGQKIELLQPVHQVVYNQKRWSIAIPSKQQSHGRAAGNDRRLPVW